MSWAVGYDSRWKRDIGYGVPSVCEYPGCGTEIDRGLAYVCGGDPYGGEYGCGLYFCGKHRQYAGKRRAYAPLCERCMGNKLPFDATPDTQEWTHHKETDPSWAEWRAEVEKLAGPSRRDQHGCETSAKSR